MWRWLNPSGYAFKTMSPSAPPAFGNGDRNHTNGLANERTTASASANTPTFDDFNVDGSDGWNVTSLYSNNYNNY